MSPAAAPEAKLEGADATDAADAAAGELGELEAGMAYLASRSSRLGNRSVSSSRGVPIFWEDGGRGASLEAGETGEAVRLGAMLNPGRAGLCLSGVNAGEGAPDVEARSRFLSIGRSEALTAPPLASGETNEGVGRLGNTGGLSELELVDAAGANESPKPSIKRPVLTDDGFESGTFHNGALVAEASCADDVGEALLIKTSSSFLAGGSMCSAGALVGRPRRMGVMLCACNSSCRASACSSSFFDGPMEMRFASMPPAGLGLAGTEAAPDMGDVAAPLTRVGRGVAILPLAAAEA